MIVKNNVTKQPRTATTSSPKTSHVGGYNNGGTTIINNINVVDNLSSNSTSSALSARQGKLLNDNKLDNNKPCTAKEIITFNKGLIINSDAKSDDFTKEKGIGITKDNQENWTLTVDNITARKHFRTQELDINHARHIAGALYCTSASATITKVLPYSNYYRCWLKLSDNNGNKAYNEFRQGDMVLSQTFNSNGSRRWWRGVQRIGADYIDVSLQACEQGSVSPVAGDEVIQFGSTNDPSRMGAVVIEPLQILVYDNINQFILPSPKLRLSPKDTKIDADQINFLGKTVINDKFMVADNGDVTMNNCTISGNLECNTFRLIGNKCDDKGRLISSFINLSGTYILPQLQPDEVRRVEVMMGRPIRTTVDPVVLTVENNNRVKINVQDNGVSSDVNRYEITDSQWQLTGMANHTGSVTMWSIICTCKFV